MALLTSLFPAHIHTSRLALDLWNGSPTHYAACIAVGKTPTALAFGDDGIETPADWDALDRSCRLRGPRFAGGRAEQVCAYMMRERGGDGKVEGEAVIGIVSLSQRVGKTEFGGVVVAPPDLGWAMVAEEWMGKGLATEGAQALLRVARVVVGEVVALVASDQNQASNRVAEKLGFVDGGECPSVDDPGSTVKIWILPGGRRIDGILRAGIGFKPDQND